VSWFTVTSEQDLIKMREFRHAFAGFVNERVVKDGGGVGDRMANDARMINSLHFSGFTSRETKQRSVRDFRTHRRQSSTHAKYLAEKNRN